MWLWIVNQTYEIVKKFFLVIFDIITIPSAPKYKSQSIFVKKN